MSQAPAELKYAESHEWLRIEADGTVTIGIDKDGVISFNGQTTTETELPDLLHDICPGMGAWLCQFYDALAVRTVTPFGLTEPYAMPHGGGKGTLAAWVRTSPSAFSGPAFTVACSRRGWTPGQPGQEPCPHPPSS